MSKSLALLTAFASFSCAGAPTPPTAPRAAAPKAEEIVIDRPRAELLRELDRMVQWRFATLTPEDVVKRRFGITRMAPSDAFHPDLFVGAPGREAVGDLVREGWLPAVYVVEERDEPNSRGRVRGPVTPGKGSWTAVETAQAIERLGYQAMTSNFGVSGASHGVPLEARVVPLSSAVCLKCHAGKNLGDPVAAVVYAFHRQRPAVATPGRDSGR